MATTKSYDYIIVGAGPAGLTLASRLSTSLPDKSVLLIEAGCDPTSNPNVHTSTGFPLLPGSEQAYTLDIKASPHLSNEFTAVAVGKALGGSAAINGGAWTRGPRADYDLWAEVVGDDAWSYDAMLPFFRRTENDRCDEWRDEIQHGYSGTIATTPVSATRKYPLREAVKQAWTEVGVLYKGDPSDGRPNGVTEGIEVWQNGQRQLPQNQLDLSRVTILEGTTVSCLIFRTRAKRPIASGVQTLDGTTIEATREVIVCAGTYHTPQLLMLSGIGPAATLKEHAVPIVHANEHVGAHLKDHLATGTTWKLTPSAVNAGSSIGHPGFMRHANFLWGWPLDFLTFTSMPDSAMPTLKRLNPKPEDAALVCRSDATHLETVVLYVGSMGGKYTGIADIPMDGSHIISINMLLTPTSEGVVTIRSANPVDPPVIDARYNATESDRFLLREGMRQTVRVLCHTEAGKSFVEKEVTAPGLVATSSSEASDDELNQRIAALGVGLDHPMGSCRMASAVSETTGGVVDSHCRVFGVSGLRVVDASVIPVPVAAHIQACVYALAERVSQFIVDEEMASGQERKAN